jgi:hypothetical protein
MSNLRLQYTIGFSPSDRGKEGTYHPLLVKLKTATLCPDCKVQARRGYYAGIPAAFSFSDDTHGPSPANRIEPAAYNRLRAAAADSAELKGLAFKIETASVTDPSGQELIKVDLQIDTSRVGFQMVAGRHTARVHVAVFYADVDGIYLGCDWKAMDLRLDESSYRQMVQAGIPFSTRVPLILPKQILKVIVYDVGSDRVGSHLVRMR